MTMKKFTVTEWRTCRVCDRIDVTSALVKYSVRSYAHPDCYYQKHGDDGIRRLYAWQIRSLPVLKLSRVGLTPERLMELLREAERAEAVR